MVQTKKRIPFIFSLVAAGLMAATTAFAHGGPKDGRRGGGQMTGRMLKLFESLELTENQEVQLVRVRRAIRENRKASRVAMKKEKTAIAAEMKKATPDAARIHQAIDALTTRKQSDAHFAVDKLLEFHALLTAEQKQKLADRVDSFQSRRAERRSRRDSGRGR